MDRHILQIYQIVRTLLSNFPATQNPLEWRMGPLLQEIDWSVQQVLQLLQKQPLNKDLLKFFLSVLYRDDEEIEPLFTEWVQVSAWNESADPEELAGRKELREELQHELKQLVPYIQSLYGPEEACSIIPPQLREGRG